MSTWGQRHLCAAHSVAFTNKVVGIQAKPAVSKSEAKITMPQVCSFLFFFSKRERHKLFSDSQREGIFLRLSTKILLGVDTKHGYFLPGNNKIWTSRHPERRAGETVAGLLSSWPFPSPGEPSGGFFCAFPHPREGKGL